MTNKFKVTDYFPFMFNMLEQGSLTVNSLILNYLVFSIYTSGSNQLYQAITITIIISTTSTLVNALSTWRILDHKDLDTVNILVVELLLIGVACLVIGKVFSVWVPVSDVGWLGLGGLFFTASMFYFLRDVLVYLRSISVLIIINLATLFPLVAVYYKYADEGEMSIGVWGFFQWAFLLPRMLVLLFLMFFVAKLWGKFSIAFGGIKFTRQPFLRALASIAVAVRAHIPYFILNAVGLNLFAELYRKFFIMLSPVSQVLQANYAFFLPRKNKMHMLVPSLLLSGLVGTIGVFILEIFFWGGGGDSLYVLIVLVSFLMCLRAYYFILNRIGKDYAREIYLSSLAVTFSAVYVYCLDSGLPDYYVAHIFFINEFVYLVFASLFNGIRNRITSQKV